MGAQLLGLTAGLLQQLLQLLAILGGSQRNAQLVSDTLEQVDHARRRGGIQPELQHAVDQLPVPHRHDQRMRRAPPRQSRRPAQRLVRRQGQLQDATFGDGAAQMAFVIRHAFRQGVAVGAPLRQPQVAMSITGIGDGGPRADPVGQNLQDLAGQLFRGQVALDGTGHRDLGAGDPVGVQQLAAGDDQPSPQKPQAQIHDPGQAAVHGRHGRIDAGVVLLERQRHRHADQHSRGHRQRRPAREDRKAQGQDIDQPDRRPQRHHQIKGEHAGKGRCDDDQNRQVLGLGHDLSWSAAFSTSPSNAATGPFVQPPVINI